MGKTNTYTDRHHPKYQWRPQIIKTNEDHNIIHEKFDSYIKTHHEQHIIMVQRRQENLEWAGVIGALTPAPVKLNFDWAVNLKLTRLLCSAQSILSFQCHMYCVVGNTRDFPWSKSKLKETIISETADNKFLWNESQTYGLFSRKSGFGAICL